MEQSIDDRMKEAKAQYNAQIRELEVVAFAKLIERKAGLR